MAQRRVGFLGPEGSFSHEAVSTLSDIEAIPFETIADLLNAVRDCNVDQALAPLENAIEGT
ncbi:MAG: prephenate dehydratase, partial [Acidimicrobiaceae bacterium]|nr:prephenate dehydratase [Acidimicrobiaceae bacterium]